MNYEKLMSHNPTIYGEMTNSIGQKIVFVEHPLKGEDSFVICVCHELKMAEHSNFFELDDMTASHKEYEPKFVDGLLVYGDL